MYSTCTFSELENEGTIAWLLQNRPQFKLIEMQSYEGFSKGRNGLEECVRIFPHKMEGEGHFLALLEKEGEAKPRTKAKVKSQKLPEEAEAFLKDCKGLPKGLVYYMQEDRIYALGADDGMPTKLRYLRTGLLLGTCKKKRFEPSQALAMALTRDGFVSSVSFSRDDERVIRYLKGETLDIEDKLPLVKEKKGWQLVCVEDYPLGWAKLTQSSLKNKYYAGWRYQ